MENQNPLPHKLQEAMLALVQEHGEWEDELVVIDEDVTGDTSSDSEPLEGPEKPAVPQWDSYGRCVIDFEGGPRIQLQYDEPNLELRTGLRLLTTDISQSDLEALLNLNSSPALKGAVLFAEESLNPANPLDSERYIHAMLRDGCDINKVSLPELIRKIDQFAETAFRIGTVLRGKAAPVSATASSRSKNTTTNRNHL